MVESATAKDLIAQIQSMRVSGPMYDAVVAVLSEYINHSVDEEQVFRQEKKSPDPLARSNEIDITE